MSNPPMKAPTNTEMTMTVIVRRIVSFCVGQVTFFNSAATSDMNFIGATFGMLGTLGLFAIDINYNKSPPKGEWLYYSKRA